MMNACVSDGVNLLTVWCLGVSVRQMVECPYETRSDSFYFVDNRLVMHNKADYAYNGGQWCLPTSMQTHAHRHTRTCACERNPHFTAVYPPLHKCIHVAAQTHGLSHANTQTYLFFKCHLFVCVFHFIYLFKMAGDLKTTARFILFWILNCARQQF